MSRCPVLMDRCGWVLWFDWAILACPGGRFLLQLLARRRSCERNLEKMHAGRVQDAGAQFSHWSQDTYYLYNYIYIYIYILHISIFYVINTSGYIWIYTTSSNSVCINIESGRVWCSNGIPRDGPILWIRGLLQPESSRTAMCSHQILR